MTTGRFAPSTTGPAHPGTLLAALLCWLDARSRNGRLVVRLEDLDPERCRPEFARGMTDDLRWLGLDWDALQVQSQATERHAQALDRLDSQGLLYPCRCTRSQLKSRKPHDPELGSIYPGTCRRRRLPAGGWRACPEALRVRLPGTRIELRDVGGADLSGDPAQNPGDPIVRRRDGAVAYALAGICDDAHAGVTHVVRGRDLAATTPTQAALQDLLDLPRPHYRHHLLLLEERGEKLAKFHGAVGSPELRARYTGSELCGLLAVAAGLQSDASAVTPRALLSSFDWSRVAASDRTLRWTGERLELLP